MQRYRQSKYGPSTCQDFSNDLSSAHHHIGIEVLIQTMDSSGTRWFEVDTRPLKDDSVSASNLVNSITLIYYRCLYSLRFHRRPDVESIVDSIPKGNSPQVGPKTSWSMTIRCSPYISLSGSIWEEHYLTYFIKHPCNIFICHGENIFAHISNFMKLRKSMHSLV